MNTHDIEPMKYGGNKNDDYVTGWNDCWAVIEADHQQKGVVVVTRTQDGEIVAVTRQDEEGRILTVIAEADRKCRGEPVAWLYEDELPDNYPYEAMFPYSKVDGVRMFPVYAPQPAEPVKVPSDDDLFAIHDEYFPTMVMGHDNYLNFARALLTRYGNSHSGSTDGKRDPAIQTAWHAGWDAAQEARSD